jgi:hypothetical protein
MSRMSRFITTAVSTSDPTWIDKGTSYESQHCITEDWAVTAQKVTSNWTSGLVLPQNTGLHSLFYFIPRVPFTALCKYLPYKESLLHTFFLPFLYVCSPLIRLRRSYNSVLMFCFRIPNSSRRRHIHSHADTSLMDCFLCNLNTFIYCRGREAYNLEYECGYEPRRVLVLGFWSIYSTG